MKFTFRWLINYRTRNNWTQSYVHCSRGYVKQIDANDITEAYNKFYENRNNAVSSWSSIKDENGAEYYDKNANIVRGYHRPLIMDLMVKTKRNGYTPQYNKDGVINKITGRKIKHHIDIGDGYFVSPNDMKNINLTIKSGSKELPYMTFDEIVNYFNKNSDAGIWRSYSLFTVISDKNDGQTEVVFTDSKPKASLQEHGYLSGNQYGGFKTYYSSYDCIPKGSEPPEKVNPLWMTCRH